MAVTEQGKIHEGCIVFPEPIPLPEGTEVLVHIEPLPKGEQDSMSMSDEAYLSQPFFGLWKDRDEMNDSVAWVRREREKWQHRLTRQD